uniref:Serine/threonine protein kinase n=1 Tax=Geobacter sp. (strain M21) TaxID=443144 RepID=C6E1F5_GEOSM
MYTVVYDKKARTATYLNNGVYGEILLLDDGKTVIKLFKKRERIFEQFIVDSTIKSEINAYEIVSSHDLLAKYIPNFFGAVQLTAILHNNKPVSHLYCSSAYLLEYINSPFEKVACSSKAKEIISLFNHVGVLYTEDADYCEIEQFYKFIDFGIVGVKEALEDISMYGLSDEEKIDNFQRKFGKELLWQ